MIKKHYVINRTSLADGVYSSSNNFIFPEVGSIRYLILNVRFRATGATSSVSFSLLNFSENTRIQIWNRFGEMIIDSRGIDLVYNTINELNRNSYGYQAFNSIFRDYETSLTPGTSGRDYDIYIFIYFPTIYQLTKYDDMKNTYDFSNYVLTFPSSLRGGDITISNINYNFYIEFYPDIIVFSPTYVQYSHSTENRIINLPRRKYRRISCFEIFLGAPAGSFVKVFDKDGLYIEARYGEYIITEDLFNLYYDANSIANVKETEIIIERNFTSTVPLMQSFYLPNNLSRYPIKFDDDNFKVALGDNSPNITVNSDQAIYLPIVTKRDISRNKLEEIKSLLR